MLLKRYCKVKASSILESVIALTIISICLYVAVLIFAVAFSPKTSAKFYITQQRANELFYEIQVGKDSLMENLNAEVETELLQQHLTKVNIVFKDSLNSKWERSYYLNAE